MNNTVSPGKVQIDNNKIFWNFKGKNIFQIDLNEIAIIGEYTTSDGPWFDDWFLTFVTKDGQWQSIPWDAENMIELTQVLCDNFQTDLNASFLTSSTNWNSVVRHPTNLKNKPLFVLIPRENKKTKTFFDKLLSSIGVGNLDNSKYIELTDDVKNELKNFKASYDV